MTSFYNAIPLTATPHFLTHLDLPKNRTVIDSSPVFGRPFVQKLDIDPASAPGLVSISTSDTNLSIQLPAQETMRLKRLQKVVRVTAQVLTEHLQQNHVRYTASMVTLTYAPHCEFQPRQVTAYIKCVLQWAKRRGYFAYYVWVLELTKSGRPHYHVVWFLPKGATIPKADKQGWWKCGMTNTVKARSPVGYLCKYTSKGICADSWGKLPRGARLHGNGGYSSQLRQTKIWHCAPLWVRLSVPFEDKVKKVGSYWVNRRSGMGQTSPWLYCWKSRVIRFAGFLPAVHITEFLDRSKRLPAPIPMPYDVSLLRLEGLLIDSEWFAIDRAFIECAV